MSAAGRSLFIYGIYQLVLGIIVILIPNWLLSVLGLPNATDVWVRAAGVLFLVIGFYDLQAGRKSLNEFCLWSIITRIIVFLFLLVFVLLGFAKPLLIAFGALELIGAAWTFFALQLGV